MKQLCRWISWLPIKLYQKHKWVSSKFGLFIYSYIFTVFLVILNPFTLLETLWRKSNGQTNLLTLASTIECIKSIQLVKPQFWYKLSYKQCFWELLYKELDIATSSFQLRPVIKHFVFYISYRYANILWLTNSVT